MGFSFNKIYLLCAIYVFFMWAMFFLDNLIFLVLRLFNKGSDVKSKHAFSNAFMQRGKNTETFMAVVNVIAYVGFIMWIISLFK